jgi:metal-sulfur cluster biosynthetic enzyme
MNAAQSGTSPSPETIRTALFHLIDPEVGVNVVDLGMIGEISVDDDGRATVEILPTTPGCPMHDMLAQGATFLVGNLPGVTRVDIRFVYDPPWTPERITPEGRAALDPQ